jgi:activator of HSP90 ATPase
MKTKTLHQTIVFKATAHELYEALMDSKKHAAFTESQAKISRKVGGDFQAYDGYATGKNVELTPDKKIVQTWRASDWPEDHFSTVTFVFTEKNGETTVDFTQTEIPDEAFPDIKQGWQEWYWDRLKAYLEPK